MRYDVDPLFQAHFRKIRQVFMYITDECNISCEQCIYKPNVTYNEERSIPLPVAVDLLADFFEMGARKVTFLGGEPTLYGFREAHEPLYRLIEASQQLGYEYIRLDTNGQFSPRLLADDRFKLLHEIAFSLDGPTGELNDPVRGPNTFDNCVQNLDYAVSLGYRATITCCIHRDLLTRTSDGDLWIEEMIRFGEKHGVMMVNFHDLFKAGVPMDTWTGDLATSVEDHVAMYAELREKIEAGCFSVHVRLPQCFVTAEEFDSNPEYYGYCPVKLGERIMVHPNGVLRICSNLICSSFGVGRYFDRTIWWDRSGTNELRHHDLDEATPCTNRSKNKTYGKYVPLCFSFKPQQKEFVWSRQLEWDERAQGGRPRRPADVIGSSRGSKSHPALPIVS